MAHGIAAGDYRAATRLISGLDALYLATPRRPHGPSGTATWWDCSRPAPKPDPPSGDRGGSTFYKMIGRQGWNRTVVRDRKVRGRFRGRPGMGQSDTGDQQRRAGVDVRRGVLDRFADELGLLANRCDVDRELKARGR